MKKNREEDFEVPVGCHDGAETCELFGTFIFNKISPIMQEQNNVGLHRDDGLGIFRNLPITVTTNITSANYRDVNFDLTKDIYEPYRKPNDQHLYINRHSDHPPNTARPISLSVSS